MRVTDVHMHLWGDPKCGFPFEPLYNLERLENDMSLAEVDRAVLIPVHAGFEGDMLGADEYCFEVAKLHPHRFVVMALFDEAIPNAPAALAEMMKRPGMKGLRLRLGANRPGRMEWLWPMMVLAALPVAVAANRGSLPMLASILERNPELSVLLDHVGLPAEGPDPFADLDKVLALAKYKNLVVKASALVRYSREAYPFRDIHEQIHRLYDTFGPQRLAWGSNYSTHPKRPTYRQDVDLFRVCCDFFSTSDVEWVMNKTASRVLNWDY